MTKEERLKAIDLCIRGKTYNEIAKVMHIPLNTIKSYLRRNKVKMRKEDRKNEEEKNYCKTCGHEITEGRRQIGRRFCSIACKTKWFNKNRDKVNSKNRIDKTCPTCKDTFKDYVNGKRKYCSHKCYILSRFKGVNNERNGQDISYGNATC